MGTDELVCIVEIPKGSRNKYEHDARYGGIRFDRFLSASVVYPTDYGYFPDTLGPDGDELDALVCVTEPTFPGCIVPVKAIGLFKMVDEKGPDDKVVCVPFSDPNWNCLAQIDDLPDQVRQEITHFFSVYKDLDPDRESEAKGWADREQALALIQEAQDRFRSEG
ncbi:MAG: inorganic diphosphatase [Actinomycetota bacterium]|nr:inorganic diphosphatase [Actinomycetota bacterium]